MQPIRELLKRMKPTGFKDIVASLALYRPGPMGVNAHWDYADRKNGRKEITPIHRWRRGFWQAAASQMMILPRRVCTLRTSRPTSSWLAAACQKPLRQR